MNIGFQHLPFIEKAVSSQTKMKQLHNMMLINHYMQQKIKRLGTDFSNTIYTFYFIKYYITIVTMKYGSRKIIP